MPVKEPVLLIGCVMHVRQVPGEPYHRNGIGI